MLSVHPPVKCTYRIDRISFRIIGNKEVKGESGDLIEFVVHGREYGMLAEGDCGELTFQGTRYIDFLDSRWTFLWRTGLFCTPIFIKKSLSVRPVRCFLPQSEPSIQKSGDIADECLRSVLRIAA